MSSIDSSPYFSNESDRRWYPQHVAIFLLSRDPGVHVGHRVSGVCYHLYGIGWISWILLFRLAVIALVVAVGSWMGLNAAITNLLLDYVGPLGSWTVGLCTMITTAAPYVAGALGLAVVVGLVVATVSDRINYVEFVETIKTEREPAWCSEHRIHV